MMLVMCVGMTLLDSDLRVASVATDAGDVCWQSDARRCLSQLMLMMLLGSGLRETSIVTDAGDVCWRPDTQKDPRG